jgi:hypothetical protein
MCCSLRASTNETGDEVRLRTPFLYVEARGESQILLSGTARHHLVRSPSTLGLVDPPEAHRPAQRHACVAGDPVVHLSYLFIPTILTGATT